MIRIDGEPGTLASPAAALQLGIGTVYQDPLVYPEFFSVAQSRLDS
jgi:ABC-type uncharacterized transport system ATPase subunit